MCIRDSHYLNIDNITRSETAWLLLCVSVMIASQGIVLSGEGPRVCTCVCLCRKVKKLPIKNWCNLAGICDTVNPKRVDWCRLTSTIDLRATFVLFEYLYSNGVRKGLQRACRFCVPGHTVYFSCFYELQQHLIWQHSTELQLRIVSPDSITCIQCLILWSNRQYCGRISKDKGPCISGVYADCSAIQSDWKKRPIIATRLDARRNLSESETWKTRLDADVSQPLTISMQQLSGFTGHFALFSLHKFNISV